MVSRHLFLQISSPDAKMGLSIASKSLKEENRDTPSPKVILMEFVLFCIFCVVINCNFFGLFLSVEAQYLPNGSQKA
jgi:hypothetical protein